MTFPKEIQRSLYTNNLIENFNKRIKKRIKKRTKVKEQFPNENALDLLVCTISLEYNERFGNRIHKGFGKVQAELREMFSGSDSL